MSGQNYLPFQDVYSKLKFSDAEIVRESLANHGDFSRIKAVLRKAKQGEDIVIGAIGGSITMGAGAGAPEERWVNIVARWFCLTFPDIKVSLYNAGIGATNSKFGALRAYEDLLQYEPDIVFFEYSVNDNINDMAEEGTEGLLRQLLTSVSDPAVVMVGMMNRWGGNVQHKHLPLAKHYNVPFISLRNLCEPRIKDERIDPEWILADDVHPNSSGHRLIARMIILHLEKSNNSSSMPLTTKANEIPDPLYPDPLEKLVFYKAPHIDFSQNKGWTLREHDVTMDQPWRLHGKPIIGKVWNAVKSGSVISFDYEGTFFALTYYQYKAGSASGLIRIEIDGIPCGEFWAEGDQTWGGMHKTVIMGLNLPYAKHRVKIELMDPGYIHSETRGFDIIAIAHGVQE
jgi:lysophospholipase L1-like esterase